MTKRTKSAAGAPRDVKDRRKLLVGIGLTLAAGAIGAAANASPARRPPGAGAARSRYRYRVRRLIDAPIITQGMDERMGGNIQGPSLIRVPDWVSDPLGRYYLYFADHKGAYIRLAYADRLEGPWRVHPAGSLQLAESGFPTEVQRMPEGFKMPTLEGFAPAGTPGIPTLLEDATLPHIASPDAHVDAQNRRIILYYHGLARFGVQHSRVAVSGNGIDFQPVGGDIGPAYLRAFDHGGFTFALSGAGLMLRSIDGFTPFEPGPRLFGRDQRHVAVLKRGDTLHVFWTQAGDAPERIYASTVELKGDWTNWSASEPIEILRPERTWEGADLPIAPSYRSATSLPVNQLRDPAIYEEAGRVYLLYAVKGEGGIAIAELTIEADDQGRGR